MANEHYDSVRFFWDHNAMATKWHYCDRNGLVGTMATKEHYLVDLFCDCNGSAGTMAKQHYLADLICDHNGSVRSNMANRSKQNTIWLMYRVQKWHTLSSGFDKLHLRKLEPSNTSDKQWSTRQNDKAWNCDVIQNGAEKVNHGTKKHGSAFACVHREPTR